MKEYEKRCLALWDGRNSLDRAILGLVAEAGEVAGCYQKHLRGDFDYKEFKKRAIKELGDVLYNAVILAFELGVDLDTIMAESTLKMTDRWVRNTIKGDGDDR